jgi:hypothetical protein
MAFELSDLDEIDVTFDYRKPDGSPGEIDLTGPPPTVTMSDPSGATVTLAPDLKSGHIRSNDDLPADVPVDFSFPVDVDLGTGTKPIQVQWSMVIKSHTSGEVSTVNVGFGEPTPKS